MRWGLVVAFGGFGAAVGVVTGLALLPWWAEPALWVAGFAVWLPLLAWRADPPMPTSLVGGSVAGLAWGTTLAALPGVIPWHGLLAQGLVGGFLAGGLTGGLAWGVLAARGMRVARTARA